MTIAHMISAYNNCAQVILLFAGYIQYAYITGM